MIGLEQECETYEEMQQLEKDAEEARARFEKDKDDFTKTTYLAILAYLAGAYAERGEREKAKKTGELILEVAPEDQHFAEIAKEYLNLTETH